MTAPTTAAELVASFEGRERTGLTLCLEAAAKFKDIIETRLREDARALGLDDPLAPVAEKPAPTPPARKRRAAERPAAPEDDTALIAVLLAELDKGDASSLALAKRFTGLTKERTQAVLFKSSNLQAGGPHVKTNGRKWSRVAP